MALPPSLDAATEPELVQLQALVQRHAGLRVDAAKLRFSLQRAWPELQASGVADLRALIGELSFMAGRLWGVFLPYVTINETYFMREPAQLEEFARLALPELAERSRSPLRLLSAACSTGEEAYSLATLLADAQLPGQVTGIDIDPQAIERAEAGIYGANSFRATSEAWRQSRFEPVGPGQWWIKEPYRAMTSFRRLNLLTLEQRLAAHRFDAIFCRNVLIYFDRPTQLAVIEQLGRLLVPGGYLCLGHAEMFFGVDLGLAPRVTARATMYQREEGR